MLDEKLFKVSEAKVGYNCPSMYPFCRSTIISAYIDIDERIARDYETNENYKTKARNYNEYEKEQNEKEANKYKIGTIDITKYTNKYKTTTNDFVLFPERLK